MKLINLIEAKQVGILYHYTSVSSFFKILDENVLKISRILKGNKKLSAVSFTRDKNFHSLDRGIGGEDIRFVVDGNKLSNNYKIEPFFDANFPNYRSTAWDESEEIVLTKSGIKNFISYVIRIDIDKDSFFEIYWHYYPYIYDKIDIKDSDLNEKLLKYMRNKIKKEIKLM